MKWSWKLGEVAGIGVFVHATFLLLLAWFGLRAWTLHGTVAAVVTGIVFILAIFACVVLHELGHALCARRYGIKTRDITLLPIGGLARLERIPEDPRQELWVALAGPAVNVAIAGVLLVVLALTSGPASWGNVDVFQGALLANLLAVNLIMALFNMLPAFPMDGGRVVRALLATRMSYTRATQIAAGLGQAMAFLLGFWGFSGQPLLILIAFFVWIGAVQEANMVQVKAALRDLPVRSAMLTEFRALAPHDSLAQAVDLILAGSQQDFPVVDREGLAVGLLTRKDLLAALAQRGRDTRVEEAMQRDVVRVAAWEPLEKVITRLQGETDRMLLVTEGDALIGLLTLENVSELLMIRTALSEEGAPPLRAAADLPAAGGQGGSAS